MIVRRDLQDDSDHKQHSNIAAAVICGAIIGIALGAFAIGAVAFLLVGAR